MCILISQLYLTELHSSTRLVHQHQRQHGHDTWPDEDGGSNDQLHHEILGALQMRLLDAPVDPRSSHDFNVLELLQMRWPEASMNSLGLSARNFEDFLSEIRSYSAPMTGGISAQISQSTRIAIGSAIVRCMSAEQRRTAHDLLKQVKHRLNAFRLLDLPRELREIIYGMALEEPVDPGADRYAFHGPMASMPGRVLALVKVDFVHQCTGTPSLLHVSRQVRSEAGKQYFGSKRFEIYIDTDYCRRVQAEVLVKTWFKTIVGNFATHLRHVNVHISYMGPDCDHETTMQVQFHRSHGLEITGSTRKWTDINGVDEYIGEPQLFVDMPAYVAELEGKRIARNQKGEVIVDFFEDWGILRRICSAPSGPRRLHTGFDAFGEPIYEYLTNNPVVPNRRSYEYKW